MHARRIASGHLSRIGPPCAGSAKDLATEELVKRITHYALGWNGSTDRGFVKVRLEDDTEQLLNMSSDDEFLAVSRILAAPEVHLDERGLRTSWIKVGA